MLNLTHAFLMNLGRQGILSKDGDGRTIFTGLTRAESERYHALSDSKCPQSFRDAAEFLMLDNKHSVALLKTMPTTDRRTRPADSSPDAPTTIRPSPD